MTNRTISYGTIQYPRYRVHIVFESPQGEPIGEAHASGTVDYARGDWERFNDLPPALRQEIVEELREVVIEELLLE